MVERIAVIETKLDAIRSRNAIVDERDAKFIKQITTDISYLKAWVMVFKIIGGVLVTTLIPFLAWVALSILDEKVRHAEYKNKEIPISTQPQKVKVKSDKRKNK